MSVDHFDYPELGLSVDRGKVGDPSIVTLDWVTVDDDGQDHDRKLVLGCELCGGFGTRSSIAKSTTGAAKVAYL